jgi:hypothetical protein
MPGSLKSKSFRDETANLLNSMGEALERAAKPDLGLPGIHTQSGFFQPREQPAPDAVWVTLSENLDPGSIDEPSDAYGTILRPNYSPMDQSLGDTSEPIQVFNYVPEIFANEGDTVLAVPINGIWTAVLPAASSTSETINFEILDWCPGLVTNTCECVRATVTRVSCGSHTLVGDEVIIWDKDLCWFNIPVELLTGLRGTAQLMENNPPVGDVSCPETPQDPSDCIWVVTSTCCREESYD